MAISREEIQKIASLARLDLSEAEILKYQEQLSSILKHIDALKKADSDDLEILGLNLSCCNKNREDVVRSWDEGELKTALGQVKEMSDGQIKVQRVL